MILAFLIYAVEGAERSGMGRGGFELPMGLPPRGTFSLELSTLGLAAPAGVEPATNCLEGSCSNPLSYGASFP